MGVAPPVAPEGAPAEQPITGIFTVDMNVETILK